MRKRWFLLVKDVRGVVIYNQAFRTRRGAHRQGMAITSPPLNRYEVVHV